MEYRQGFHAIQQEDAPDYRTQSCADRPFHSRISCSVKHSHRVVSSLFASCITLCFLYGAIRYSLIPPCCTDESTKEETVLSTDCIEHSNIE